ncbi:FHA domain-containing protein [Novipirellula caenicola]|uniref:FHA domain-containing protein n=1 Tax=Novipirellula caenicola TaxID=1536901 RepID=A0ABP9VP78_9BACT
MPVCPKCKRWIELGQRCAACGTVDAQMTAVDFHVNNGPNLANAPGLANVPGLANSTSSSNDTDVHPLSPERRVPTPLLIALDDDSETEGEVLRLRKAETILGRRHADWCFANDADISSLHAKIQRTSDGRGGCVWQLVDQQSTNGTYVYKPIIHLAEDDSFMIGGVSCRWERSQRDPPSFQIAPIGSSSPAIHIPLGKRLQIGRDESAADIILPHPTINPLHAELYETDQGWILEDQQSRNGIWHRINSVTLASESRFILGEQRFVFRLPNLDTGSFDSPRMIR